jgi:type IX secretion system PorP/SprF family membrane protein
MKNTINKMKKLFFALILLLVSGFQANAQFEPQFTQYMFNEMFINPAYAGSRDQISATLSYRNQWVGLQGAPKTQSASVHGPLMNKKMGLGLTMMNETIGVTRMFSVSGSQSATAVHCQWVFRVGSSVSRKILKKSSPMKKMILSFW